MDYTYYSRPVTHIHNIGTVRHRWKSIKISGEGANIIYSSVISTSGRL